MHLYEQRYQPSFRRYAVGQPAQPVTPPPPLLSNKDLLQLGTIALGGGLMALGAWGVVSTQSPKRTEGVALQMGSIASIIGGLYVGLKGLGISL